MHVISLIPVTPTWPTPTHLVVVRFGRVIPEFLSRRVNAKGLSFLPLVALISRPPLF